LRCEKNLTAEKNFKEGPEGFGRDISLSPKGTFRDRELFALFKFFSRKDTEKNVSSEFGLRTKPNRAFPFLTISSQNAEEKCFTEGGSFEEERCDGEGGAGIKRLLSLRSVETSYSFGTA